MSLPRLTFALIGLAAVTCAWAAPPRVVGNRPVQLTPEAAPPHSGQAAGINAAAGQERIALAQPAAGNATSPQPANPETAVEPLTALQRARDRVAGYSSIRATLVEVVSIAERGFKAEGRYLQSSLKPNDWHVRLELTLKLGANQGNLLEVCDGEVLWTRHEITIGRKKDQQITRRNVTQILEAARKLGTNTEANLVKSLGLGGIPELLASLEREMKFSSLKEESLRSRQVFVLQGNWNDDAATRWLGDPAKRDKNAALPLFVPDEVRVSLDRETGFPLRLLYLKKMPDRDVMRPMLTLDFLDVALNEPVDASEFHYEPPDRVTPVEITPMYLEQLKPLAAPAAPAQPGTPSR